MTEMGGGDGLLCLEMDEEDMAWEWTLTWVRENKSCLNLCKWFGGDIRHGRGGDVFQLRWVRWLSWLDDVGGGMDLLEKKVGGWA